MKLERNDNSKDLLESMKQNDASSNDMESSMDAESAAGWKDAPGNPSPFTDDDAQKGTVKNEMTDEQKAASVKQIIGKKRAFPRYYDRSLLTAEELERLRRREREYQRRRRARLREAKVSTLQWFSLFNPFHCSILFTDNYSTQRDMFNACYKSFPKKAFFKTLFSVTNSLVSMGVKPFLLQRDLLFFLAGISTF